MFRQLRVYIKIFVNRIAHQRHRYINDKNFLVLVALWVGVLSGIAAVVLKTSVHYLQHLLEGDFNIRYENFLYLFYPLVGIFLCVIYVRLFHKKSAFEKGLSSIIYAISRKGSMIERHKTYSQIITATLTVGFGGSVGLEAPIAVTGSAIGANSAKDLLMNRPHRTLLLACGAAAGIAAVFNSPIAGVIFAFEVLLSEVSIPAFIPLLMASAAGAVVSKIFHSQQIFFLTTNNWSLSALPFYLLLGVFCGLLSTYMIRVTISTEHFFIRRKNPWVNLITGGIVLGALLFLFPLLYGEGYDIVNKLMSGNYTSLLNKSLFYNYNTNEWFILGFVAFIVLAKVFAAAITINAGGNGGIFAPALFTGAMGGFLFSHFFNVTKIASLNEQNFVAVAMCGLISGALHAPLTGIFLIAEITGGYVLFIPLMIVSAMSYFVTRYFEPNSIYKKTLIERGFIADDKDSELLHKMEIRQILETDFYDVKDNQYLRQLIEAIGQSKRNIFPVINDSGELVGIITMDDLKEVMFKSNLYDSMPVADLMHAPQVVVDIDEKMENVMHMFEESSVWNIPVLENRKYAGFVSKTGVLNYYRHNLIREEQIKLS